ncbi:alpha/beta fold hydrolase [Streptomyces sp. NPDC012825]|uniref:alpha/beta fold hydrolase n=1 Tax=Streptomyces sp. NPDC012825 TaxID=3364851 RepID=UPI0036A788DB
MTEPNSPTARGGRASRWCAWRAGRCATPPTSGTSADSPPTARSSSSTPGAPGRAPSPPTPARTAATGRSATSEALRARLGLERIDLLGHSAGGNLATLYAAAHPGRIRSLVLVTSAGRALGVTTTDEEWDAAAEVFADRHWYPEARAALDAIGPDAPLSRVHAIAAPFSYGRWDAAAREHAAAADRRTRWEAAGAHHGEGAYDPAATRRALAALTAPVLVLAGEYDAGPTPAKAAEAAALFPHAELLVQAGAGHHPWADDPDAFVRAVAAFLDPAVRTVAVDGVRLACRLAGPEDAPPVVLVHGRGENGTTWAEVAADLAADHRVYALDLRGHGLSDRPGGYGFDAFRDELGGFLKALGLTGATVVARSMGAAAAYLLARDEPGLVGRLVLEGPPVFFPLDPPRPVAERPEGPLDFDWEIVPATDARLNDPDPDRRDRLASITAPTLVLAGGPTSHVPQERLSWPADRIPGARLVTVDAGHLFHTDRPTEFLSLIR